jgi:hypothetical protein
VNLALLVQRFPTPAKPKSIKREKIDTTFLKNRAQLHVREMIAEFFADGHETKGFYWITPEFRISLSTGCFWRNIPQRPGGRPMGDVLTLFLIGRGFLTPAKPVPEGLSRVEELQLKLAASGSRTPGYDFVFEGFAKGVESLSTWLSQFPSRAEVHELVGYDS